MQNALQNFQQWAALLCSVHSVSNNKEPLLWSICSNVGKS